MIAVIPKLFGLLIVVPLVSQLFEYANTLNEFYFYAGQQDRNALIQSLSTNPEFLKNKASQANMVVDYKDWQIPLGRRFRSLKLWMVLRLYGLENLQCYIRNHINLAKCFEGLVAADSRFEVVTPRIFSLICFRLLPPNNNEDHGNNLNHDLLDAVNSTGKIFISHTVLSAKYILRFAVGAPLTEERHVTAAWKVLQDEASALLGSLQGQLILLVQSTRG